MSFETLGLVPALLRAVATEGYTTPTPIQQKSIPEVLAGRDLLGCAQTGTGKTAAFALPILQLLSGRPRKSGNRMEIRTLVLSPTRELATQIGESFKVYGRHVPLRTAVIFGGVGHEPQRRAIRQGTDILVATPGRLLDLMNEGIVRLGSLEILVLDEADRMLDMGFIHDVRRVLKAVPKERQTLFFSATMPPDIQKLSREILKDPVHVEVAPAATTADKVEQSAYFVPKSSKAALLLHLLSDPAITRAIIFTRTKRGADRVCQYLERGRVQAQVIHGNKSQGQRERALGSFRSGRARVLVATDIAARGIDVDGISHVINYELPNVPDDYVHRIGRTARAGASGQAISLVDGEERSYLRQIERLIRKQVTVTPVPTGLAAAVPHQDGHPHPEHPPTQRPRQGRPQGRFEGRPAYRPESRAEHRPEHRQEHREGHRQSQGYDYHPDQRPARDHRPARDSRPSGEGQGRPGQFGGRGGRPVFGGNRSYSNNRGDGGSSRGGDRGGNRGGFRSR